MLGLGLWGLGLGRSGAVGDGSPVWAQGAIDLDFANSRYWDAGVEYDSYSAWAATVTVSVTVDTDATYFDASGVMQNALANALRFDHDPDTLDSLGLLLEGARTNLRTHSVAFDNAAWSKIRVTVSADQVAAPDGAAVADNVLETETTNTFHIDSGSVTVTAGVAYTESFHLKKLGRQYCSLDAVNVSGFAIFDIDGKAVQSFSPSTEGKAAGIAALQNGWVRPWFSFLDAASTGVSPRIFINDLAGDGLSGTHAGDITKGVTVWGAQLEAGLFPSSFIRTAASSVARSADTFTQTVAHEASGSVRLYFRTPAGKQGDQVLWQRDDGTEDNRIVCKRNSTGNLHWIVTNDGSDIVDIDLGVVADLTAGYTDFRWADDDYGASLDGGSESTDTGGTMPAGLTTIRRGHNVATTSNWFGHLLREVRGVTKTGTAPFKVTFGFITDLHYFQAKDNHDNRYGREGADKLAAAIADFDARGVDFVLFGGDIVEHYGETTQQALDELDEIVAVYETTEAPRYYTLGNHDLDLLTPAQFYAATGMDSTGYYSFDVGGIHFVVLDCNYLSDDDGAHQSANGNADTDSYYVNPAQRTWLAADLAGTELPVLVMCHAWLTGTGSANWGVANAPAVRAILEAAGNVEWVLSGHRHVDGFSTINGIRYFGMDYAVEGTMPDNAYAIVTITADRIIVEGFGRQNSYSVPRV